MGVVLMSKRELNRIDILARLDGGRLTTAAAADLMRISTPMTVTTQTGAAATGFGSGGGGGRSVNGNAAAAGAPGTAGIVIITEYVNL